MRRRSWLRPVVLAVALSTMSPAVAIARVQDPAAGHVDASSLLLSREPYLFPFAEREGWLDFLRTGPGGEKAAQRFAALATATDYARWRAGETTRTDRISYLSSGLAIRGILVSPRGPGPHPLVIFNHGGVGEAGRIVLADILAFQHLAERGYVVAASAYRGEGGSEGRPDMDGGDVDDVLALIAALSTLPQVDAGRIGMWGQSRGGLVTYGVLKRMGSLRAAVIHAGPTDLVGAPRRAEFDRYVYPDVIRDYVRDPEAALERLSPIRWPERLAPATPILLLQGGADLRVPPTDSLLMAAELQALHRPYRLVLFEGGDHALESDLLEVRNQIDRWFDLYLRDGAPPPANDATPIRMDD